MNAFTSYEPQLSWKGHDNMLKRAMAGTKGAATKAAKIKLPGSLDGEVLMMDVPSRDIINTDKTRPADKTAKIKKGTL